MLRDQESDAAETLSPTAEQLRNITTNLHPWAEKCLQTRKGKFQAIDG